MYVIFTYIIYNINNNNLVDISFYVLLLIFRFYIIRYNINFIHLVFTERFHY